MAKSKLELAAETGSFEGGLKKAMTAMRNFEDSVGGLGNATKEQNEKMAKFSSMLGNMSTTAKSTKGKLNELKTTFTELSATYNKLTEKEKASPFGKAMAQSLDKLKSRVQASNAELKGIRDQLNATGTESNKSGGALDALAGKFGMNIGQMAKFGVAAAAVTAAMKVAKDAFFANEQQLDDFYRACDSASAMYDGFLNALNTGDIQGYLSNMSEIVKAAREAYDAMDALGTFKAFNQRNELQARNNLQNAINNFREGKGSKEDVQKAGDAYIKELQKRQTLESSNYAAQIRKVAAVKGVDAKELTRILTGDYATYEKAKSVKSTGVRYETISGGNTGYKMTRAIPYATNAQEKMGEALRMFNDTALNDIQRIGTEEIQTSIEIESVRRQVDRALGVNKKTTPTHKSTASFTNKFSMNDMSGMSLGQTESMSDLNKMLSYYKKMSSGATNSFTAYTAQNGIAHTQAQIAAQPVALSLGVSTDEIVPIQEKIDNFFKEHPIELLPIIPDANANPITDTAKDTAKAWSAASQAISNAGSAMQNLEDPSAKVAGIVMQAIANVALGFAQASASKATGAAGVFGWIAAATAGVATMTATIAQIKSATKGYAEGGWVTGSSHVGDAIPAFLNAGEFVMTANDVAQANANYENAYAGRANSKPYLTGQIMYLGINNFLKGAGLGQLVTTKG